MRIRDKIKVKFIKKERELDYHYAVKPIYDAFEKLNREIIKYMRSNYHVYFSTYFMPRLRRREWKEEWTKENYERYYRQCDFCKRYSRKKECCKKLKKEIPKEKALNLIICSEFKRKRR